MYLLLTWDELRDWLSTSGVIVAGVLVTALIAIWLVGRIIPSIIKPAIEREMAGRPEVEVRRRLNTLSNVIVRTAQGLVITVAALIILPEFGIEITALIASVGIASIAIGLGAQTLVRDWLTGVFILSENQYAQGDVVTIAGVTGTVEDMSIRRTVIRDADGVLYSVPHGSVTVTANQTRDYSRVRVNVPVHVTSNVEQVRRVIDEVGKELASDQEYGSRIVSAPAFLRIETIDANGLGVHVSGTVRPGSQVEVAGALRTRLLEAFQREGIKTPWG